MTTHPIENVHCIVYESPLGRMWLAGGTAGLAGAWFEGQRHFAGPDAAWRVHEQDALLNEARRQLDAYFGGRLRSFSLPLDTRGTAFQQAVWRAIAAVPYGEVVTYGELARRVGAATAARAAGAATGRNPWSIVVPCHRIVGTSGALTGYAGGIARKRALLELEARAAQIGHAARDPRAENGAHGALHPLDARHPHDPPASCGATA
jgi:methylated-DNA-[protein]-cysteine S-methyltransferase